jgi:hypothetical protein
MKKFFGLCELCDSAVNKNSDIAPRRRGARGVRVFDEEMLRAKTSASLW